MANLQVMLTRTSCDPSVLWTDLERMRKMHRASGNKQEQGGSGWLRADCDMRVGKGLQHNGQEHEPGNRQMTENEVHARRRHAQTN